MVRHFFDFRFFICGSRSDFLLSTLILQLFRQTFGSKKLALKLRTCNQRENPRSKTGFPRNTVKITSSHRCEQQKRNLEKTKNILKF
ncbi:hypothetical protein DLM77_16450 [Leptospira yasudae]|uniref:Secreted protein n=1 Tax=Leptospira yasudae TaxID=2202201 RepID=A0ABX9M056_9LEPT|nr:hypothetical protein DLM77_16450 [Leptospira yasudae]